MVKGFISLLLYLFPIVLTSIGVAIHFFGSLKVFQQDVPWLLHVIMLVVDALVVIGLARKTKWGYGLSIALYTEQSILQPYWGYKSFLQNGNIHQLLIVSSLCIASLIVLIFNRRLFIKTSAN